MGVSAVSVGTMEGPLVLKVVIRSPDIPTFVHKYSRFVRDDRIFIFTKTPQPVGTKLRFSIELENGTSLLRGAGTVKRMRAESADSSKPPGMEVQFTTDDPRSV